MDILMLGTGGPVTCSCPLYAQDHPNSGDRPRSTIRAAQYVPSCPLTHPHSVRRSRVRDAVVLPPHHSRATPANDRPTRPAPRDVQDRPHTTTSASGRRGAAGCQGGAACDRRTRRHRRAQADRRAAADAKETARDPASFCGSSQRAMNVRPYVLAPVLLALLSGNLCFHLSHTSLYSFALVIYLICTDTSVVLLLHHIPLTSDPIPLAH